jgi:lysozyme family protein
MSEPWDSAAKHLLKVEGGYCDVSDDNGGVTNYGISIRFLKNTTDKDILNLADVDHDGDVDHDDIKHLTPEVALVIYKYAFWNPNGYDRFSKNVAVKLMDCAVNMGPKQGNKLFQRALNSLGAKLVDDGALGKGTENAYHVVADHYSEDMILKMIRTEQATFYSAIIRANPKLEKFRAGWTNRINSV